MTCPPERWSFYIYSYIFKTNEDIQNPYDTFEENIILYNLMTKCVV